VVVSSVAASWVESSYHLTYRGAGVGIDDVGVVSRNGLDAVEGMARA
jgi:hypothetical protein